MPVRELLELAFRWVHVIAAIMWVGNSLLFNWLDRNLKPAARPRDGSMGEIWLLHSGAFYEVEKTIDPGPVLPSPMHWFKWQAYTTWISGILLLIVVYYSSATAMVIGAGSTLTPAQAIGIGIATVFGGVVLYQLLWNSPLSRFPMAGAILCFALLLVLTYVLCRLFTGRAAFLHIGALMGSIMASNVSAAIIPAQRAQVDAVAKRQPPDPRYSQAAKYRSIHNNYMTFPVIALMMSSHMPSFYGSANAWAVLGVIVAGGAAIRHVLNIRFGYAHWKPVLAATMLATIAALSALTTTPRVAASLPVSDVTFEDVEHIIRQRCTVCHSAAPAIRTFGAAPGFMTFDDTADIRAQLDRIELRAVTTQTMPPANITNMTDREREVLRAWLQANR